MIQRSDNNSSRRWSHRSPAKPFRTAAKIEGFKPITPGDGGGRFIDGAGNFRAQADEKFGATAFGSSIYQYGSSPTTREESERPYEENVWVRAAVKAIATGFQRLDMKLMTGDPSLNPDATEVKNHPLIELLEEPNPLQTGAEFKVYNATAMKHDGEVVWFLMNKDGEPVEGNEVTGQLTEFPAQIVAIRGGLVEIDHDNRGWPVSYRYTTVYGDASSLIGAEFPRHSVVHFREVDPYNFTRGLGDVASLERETDLYFQQQRGIDATVRSGGQPGGFLIYDHEVSTHELDRRQESMDDSMDIEAGRGRIKVLDARAKWMPNPTRPVDMEYASNFKWLRDSILSGLGVPPPVVGIYDSATYNNIETAHREMWTGPNGILSLARLMADVVTNNLLPRLPGGRRGKLFFHFDHSNIEALREDVGTKLDRAKEISVSGIGVTFNEVLRMQGCEVEPANEGDRSWVQASLFDLEDPDVGKREEGQQEVQIEEDQGEEQEVDDGGFGGEPPNSGQGEAKTNPLSVQTDSLSANVESWLSDFERASVTRLRQAILDPSVAVLDQRVDPDSIAEEVILALLLIPSDWSLRLEVAMTDPLIEAYRRGLESAQREIAAQGISGFVRRSVNDGDIRLEMGSQRTVAARRVTATALKRIRKAISQILRGLPTATVREALSQGRAVIEAEVGKAFASKREYAEMVAQTEVGRAENGSRLAQFQAAGAKTIEWVTSSDELVRPTHAEINGSKITPGALFSNGLRYPHDPLGPPSEVINCRCKIRAVAFNDPSADVTVDTETTSPLDQ